MRLNVSGVRQLNADAELDAQATPHQVGLEEEKGPSPRYGVNPPARG